MKQIQSIEKWKPVLGYEGLYEVSNFGRVRSLPRNTTKGKVRGLSSHTFGYPQVLLSKDGNKSMRTVHQLVLEAFIGPRPKDMECRHLDGSPTNNNLKNLKWGTSSENKKDMVSHGTAMWGENNGNAKLCELDVWLIRSINVNNTKMANFLGVSDVTIGNIRARRSWRHVH